MAKSKTLAERLGEMDAADDAAEDAALWGNVSSAATSQASLANSPKFQQLIAILYENPILVAPALKWLVEKRAALSLAQLQALYTPEELDALVRQAQQR